jgi:hypothetical protein
MVPGGTIWSYRIDDAPAGSADIRVVTISKDDQHWERIFTFPNLEELTLHGPDQKQLAAMSRLHSLARLRIISARPKDISFVSEMSNLGELSLEYVSGFSDLAPLRQLKKLRLLHLENLRGVTDFHGLSGIESLVYLSMSGTTDWNQPVADFSFLKGLPNLEVLSLSWLTSKSAFPALMPIVSLKKLRTLRIGRRDFPINEYALLEAGLPGVAGAAWRPSLRHAYRHLPLPPDAIEADHPSVRINPYGERVIDDPDSYWYDFLGKGDRSIRCAGLQAEKKRAEYDQAYEAMKQDALLRISASGPA